MKESDIAELKFLVCGIVVLILENDVAILIASFPLIMYGVLMIYYSIKERSILSK